MPYSHTNSKGQTFFLRQGVTQTGKARYFFSKTVAPDALEQIPAGYHIEESVNGVVSLVKDRKQLILPEEIRVIEAALHRHPKVNNYRASAKGKQITVYERLGLDAEDMSNIFGKTLPMYSRQELLEGMQAMLDWLQDVVELADALGLERFAVLGFSVGGPYALACAIQIPRRLTKVGLADSAPPPMDIPEISAIAPFPLRMNSFLAHRLPSILKLTFAAYWRYSRHKPEAFIKTAIRQSPQPDQEILVRPDIYARLVDVWKENVRVDSRGYVQDVEILMSPWGFRLGDVTAEVHLWQGEADTNTPQAWARYMARELPHTQATFFADEGHFALFAHWKEILETLVSER